MEKRPEYKSTITEKEYTDLKTFSQEELVPYLESLVNHIVSLESFCDQQEKRIKELEACFDLKSGEMIYFRDNFKYTEKENQHLKKQLDEAVGHLKTARGYIDDGTWFQDLQDIDSFLSSQGEKE